MREEPNQERFCKPQCYMPCPCLKIEYGHESTQESLCISGEEVKDVQFVDLGFIPTCMFTDKTPKNALCLNSVYSDENGFIRCGTSKKLIKVRNCLISIKDYLEAIENVKELYQGDLVTECVCPECLYKTTVGIYLKQLRRKERSG